MSPPQENFTCAKARVDPLSQYGKNFNSFLERSCSSGEIRRRDPANTPETSRKRVAIALTREYFSDNGQISQSVPLYLPFDLPASWCLRKDVT
jgi:hypothetical protein